jgi:hypothetical protein
MTLRDNLYRLVWATEDSGARLYLGENGKPRVDRPELVPDDVLTNLRTFRDELAIYLAESKRPEPAEVPFIAKNLDVLVWPASVCRGLSVFWLGDRPYWKCTPTVLAFFFEACNARELTCRTAGSDLSWVPGALSVMESLGVWVSRHYPPHAIARAFFEKAALPKATPLTVFPVGGKQCGFSEWKAKYAPEPSRN